MVYYQIMNTMFWARVDIERERLGITRKELSRLTGISKNTIETWNARLTIPAGDKCLLISKALGVSIEYLLTGEELSLPDDDPVIQEILNNKKLYAINQILVASGAQKIDATAEMLGAKAHDPLKKEA